MLRTGPKNLIGCPQKTVLKYITLHFLKTFGNGSFPISAPGYWDGPKGIPVRKFFESKQKNYNVTWVMMIFCEKKLKKGGWLQIAEKKNAFPIDF